MSWLEASRARLRLLFGRRASESRMDQEFRFHVEMETERLMRDEGLDAAEARRRALVAFGGEDKHREALRDGRGLARLEGLSLDFRLGGRMLVKYPGLTIVGGLAMAFAIWFGAIVFEMAMLFISPSVPLPDGDRIVHMRNWDVQANAVEPRALYDFGVWRQAMRSVTDLGAWQDVSRNLGGSDGAPRPVQIASITASGFRVAAMPPLLGRTLVPADEQSDAPPVVVLGHDVWRAQFASDASIVGRSVKLGDAFATVVGVMPDGFTFPVVHEAWTPFRPSAVDDAPGRGPAIAMFARLAPGATLDDAEAELAALGMRAAQELPETHQHLQPQVMAYPQMLGGPSSTSDMLGVFTLIQVMALMLLVLVCGNVALLLFARAATRESEIIVRSALGASRRRIVLQLFAEALVLGGVAATIGLAAAHFALSRWGMPFLEANLGSVPFWIDPRLSPATVLYTCMLTVLGAAVAGVLPGLKVTRGLGSRLREGSAGGGGLQFGGVWTAVIVAQVAVTVALPAIVLLETKELKRITTHDVGFAAEEYLAVSLATEVQPGADVDSATVGADRARFGTVLEVLRQRIAAEPGVAGVTFVDKLPRATSGWRRIAIEDPASVAAPSNAASAEGGLQPLRYTKVAYVDPSYFDVLDAPVLAGRNFQTADLAPGARVAIVNQSFVDNVLQGRNPIGRSVRMGEGGILPDGPGADSLPWYRILGVVKDLGMNSAAESGRSAGLYLPAAPGTSFAPYMVIHAQVDPLALVPRVREIAGMVDPTLRLAEFQPVDQVTSPLLWVLGMWIRMTLGMTAVALLLSLAGIYAVLSFTVARRTREIGVRAALGASRRRVLTAIFRRPLTQVGLGIAAGAGLIALGTIGLARTTQFSEWSGTLSAGQIALLVGYATFMLGVCLLACIVPTRRALGVEPIVAMRLE